MRKRSLFRHVMLATSALVPLGVGVALANPLGPNVVGGNATVSGIGTSNVTIHQTTPRAVINWNTFNIGAGETTRFVQPSASSVVLNRVTGGFGPSMIQGALTANGMVYLVNPEGVMISKSGVINTAGFLASTHDITNENFMAGRFQFNIPGRPSASIVNEGTINAHSHGFAALVAPGVRNSGTITATYGKVALASSGDGYALDLYGDKLISLAVNDSVGSTVIDVATGQPLNSLVKNTGKLSANGGRVELTAAQARTVVDSVINNSGVIEARSVGQRNGKIVLGGSTTKVAGLPPQTVKVSGKLDVSNASGKGGKIQVTAEKIVIKAASFDASGTTGGGTVLIGGDTGGGAGNSAVSSIPQAKLETQALANATTVEVDNATVINASATSVGDGGKVIVWADNDTTFAGTILARGGDNGGNGGFAEVSGKQTLAYTGNVSTLAPSGTAGTLLLDPADYYIVVSLGGSPSGASERTASSIETDLNNNNNVIIATNNTSNPSGQNGDIFVQASVTWGTNATLTLDAYRNIELAYGVTITNNNNAAGNLVLRANTGGNFPGNDNSVGTIFFTQNTPGSGVDFTNSVGKIAFYSNQTYLTPTDYTPATQGAGRGVRTNPGVSDQFISYMLINSVADLQSMVDPGGGALRGSYALSRDILSSPRTPFTQHSFTFRGDFDGQGHTISDLVINGQGLFGFNSGTFRNLTLSNFTVNATSNIQFVGMIAGQNNVGGQLINVHSSGTINGGSFTGVGAGGVVGQNYGTIADATSSVNITLGDASSLASMNIAGGIAGINLGTIGGSSASGDITVGAYGSAGGLVGANGLTGPGGAPGLITGSMAFGTVSAGVTAGGLVGHNHDNGTIVDSWATGDVAGTGTSVFDNNCSFNASCLSVNAGGLVGLNNGIITSSNSNLLNPLTYVTGNVSISGAIGNVSISGAIGNVSITGATGNVSITGGGVAGGLVGFNSGAITFAYALGSVTGAAGFATPDDVFGRNTVLGGFVGANQGTVSDSLALGGTVGASVDRLLVGGFVGDNSGTISNSITVVANVIAGNFSQAGGFAGASTPSDCINCGSFGVAYNNLGKISNSAVVSANAVLGTVTVGANSIVGGFAGAAGDIRDSQASVMVTGSHDTVLGGFVAVTLENSVIQNSFADGPVTSTGPNSWIGGFTGLNVGIISNSMATGDVSGTSDSILGGFVAVNLGLIDPSFSFGLISTSGAGNLVGGFAGANLGSLDLVTSSSTYSGSGIFGSLIGANAQFINIPSGLLPHSNFPVGTFTNSSGTVGVQNPTTIPSPPSFLTACNEQLCTILRDGQLGNPNPHEDHTQIPNVVQAPPINQIPPPPIERPPTDALITLAALTQNLPVTNPTGAPTTRTPQNTPGLPPRSLAPTLPQRPTCGMGGQCTSFASWLPTGQFIPNQVVVQIPQGTSQQNVQQILAQMGLTVLGSQPLANGNNAMNLQLPPGVSIRDVILRLEQNQVVAIAQANMKYNLVQQVPAAIAPFTASTGDPAQYSMGKLHLNEAHRIASGNNIVVAVVDSEVDTDHAELKGTISNRYDATDTQARAHAHGTAMAGAIVSRDRLRGVAPGAKILAIRAFSENQSSAESTTFHILKGIEHAVSQGARVINMSFAGPYDPSLEKALKHAVAKGVILIAASGNAGPKSPPLWPGADPSVIAVTATDSGDKVFRLANRGPYISVASPGVEILAPAPQAGYQMSTGTSIATAHVSGVVALMLERDPTLTPADVRLILESTANDLGPKGRDQQFGWGLINTSRALTMVDEYRRKRGTTSTSPVQR